MALNLASPYILVREVDLTIGKESMDQQVKLVVYPD